MYLFINLQLLYRFYSRIFYRFFLHRRSASMNRTAISFLLVNRSIRQIVSIAIDRFFSSSNLFFLFVHVIRLFDGCLFSCPVGFILLIQKEKIFTTIQVCQA